MVRFLCLFCLGTWLAQAGVQDPPYSQSQEQFCRETARKIGVPRDDSLAGFQVSLERLRQQVFSDRVAFFFEVSARFKDGQLLLTGHVDRPEFQEITRGVFRHLGWTSQVDQIEVLLDDQNDLPPFGLAVEPHVLTWSQPDLRGVPMDEALLGEPVYLLKEWPEVWLVKTWTGYWGYARKASVNQVSRAEFIRWLNEPKVTLRQDYQVGRQRLPTGCRLLLKDWGDGEVCQVWLPGGSSLELPKAICHYESPPDREAKMAKVLQTARSFLGAPYQLGGKNSLTGIDCSGIIQMGYRSVGLSLPRDAKQQYLGGYLILPQLKEALLPGDVIYFISDMGQVDHTGLYLGQGQMLHATLPHVNIRSIYPTASNYFKRFDHDFLGAKRFLY